VLRGGTLTLNATAVDARLDKAQPAVNQATCSGWLVQSGPVRLTSGKHSGQCDNNTQPVRVRHRLRPRSTRQEAITPELAAAKVLSLPQRLPHTRMKKTLLIGLAISAVTAAAVTTVPANAASRACGDACLTLTAQEFGHEYVTAVPLGSVRAGTPIVMAPGSAVTREDFESSYYGTALAAYTGGQMVSAAVAQGWPSDPVYQIFYAPGGVRSDLCLGVAGTAETGTEVTLQPCNTPLRTEWIALLSDADNGYTPLISGTGTSTTSPLVLTANSQSSALTTSQLITFPGNAYPATNQMWQALYGIIRTYAISHIPPRI
jgi:hypothetical protein